MLVYPEDDEFKAKARLHQSRFRVNHLHADFQDKETKLSELDALAGKNFYLAWDGLFDEVTKRYSKSGRIKYTPLLYDMLRSEHIPFNFFVPIKHDAELGRHILNHFLKGEVEEIKDVKIEYAPKPPNLYLNDRTSFDVYIEYQHTDGSAGFIGVEVKYTEKEYRYTKKEKAEIFNPKSEYNLLTKCANIYKETSIEILKTIKYKQVWRNQLLGEKLLRMNPRFKHFTSAILFPKGNKHFVDVCATYQEFFKDNSDIKFCGITFEDFIDVGKSYSTQNKTKLWLEYLRLRYLVLD